MDEFDEDGCAGLLGCGFLIVVGIGLLAFFGVIQSPFVDDSGNGPISVGNVLSDAPDPAETKEALAEADQLWQDGERFDAIKKYKQLLSGDLATDGSNFALAKPVRARLYRRIIEHEAEYGDKSDALDYAQQAWTEGHEGLAFNSEVAEEIWRKVSR